MRSATSTWSHPLTYDGGAAVWSQVGIDPSLGLAYISVGNPIPYGGEERGPGQEWFTDGELALHLTTGKFAWFFQEVHHDTRTPSFSTRLERIDSRVGQAHGYQLEEILHLEPETIARAGEGDAEAERICDAQRFKDFGRTAAGQKPSMGQDMEKGRRTEIEFLNGLVVREGEEVGLACRANAVLVDIVKKVEKGELKADPKHITELRLN